MLKRFVSFICAVSLLFTIIPARATAESTADAVAIREMYVSFLLDVYSNPQNYYTMDQGYVPGTVNKQDVEGNDFAIHDIDGDGTEELIISFSSTYTSAMYTGIWKADLSTETVYEFARTGVSCAFYANNIIKVDAPHNHSSGYSIWPYSLLKCDAENEMLIRVASAYCVDQAYDPYGEDYDAALDADGDGTIYYFRFEGEDPIPLTYAAYCSLVDAYIPADQKLPVEWKKLTLENIQSFYAQMCLDPSDKHNFEIIGMCYARHPGYEYGVPASANVGTAANDGYYLAQQGLFWGLIDLNGNWVVPANYIAIGLNGDGAYGLDKGNSFNTDSIDVFTQDGSIETNEFIWAFYEEFREVSWDTTNQCFVQPEGNGGFYRLNADFTGTLGVEALKVLNIRRYEEYPDDYCLIDYQLESPYMAIATDGELKTDFIYEDVRACSDGLIAVKKNGKWGYADKEGNIVIPIQYEGFRFYTEDRVNHPTWDVRDWKEYELQKKYSQEQSLYPGAVRGYVYPADCTNGYVVLFDGADYALYNNLGEEIIPFGEYEGLSEVYEGRLWVKQNGTWNVMRLADIAPKPALEGFTRSDWIKQHMEYAGSNEFQTEVTQKFRGPLGDAFIDVRDNAHIKAYNTLDSFNKILGFRMNEINDTQEYELLLAQILFSYSGTKSLQEIYSESFLTEIIGIGNMINQIYSANDSLLGQGLDDQAIGNLIKNKKFEPKILKQLGEILKSVETLTSGSDEFMKACDELINLLAGVADVSFNNDLVNVLKSSGNNFLQNVAIDEIALAGQTAKELLMYIAAGEAYCKTSDAFGEMLLQMRRNIGVPSDNPLFSPMNPTKQITNRSICRDLGIDGLGLLEQPDPLNTPIVLSELAAALERMYLSLEECKNGNAWALAQNALSDFNEGSQRVLQKNTIQSSVALFAAIPVVREFLALQKLFNGTQIMIDIFTNIDDRAYLGTMLMRLQAISCIHYKTVANLAGVVEADFAWGGRNQSTEERVLSSWNTLPINANSTLEEYQFSRAVYFNESINVYKAISSVAAIYAQEYYATYNNDRTIPSSKKLEYYKHIMDLEAQLQQIDAICCHGSPLNVSSNDPDFSDTTVKMYVIACPVDMIVQSDANEQIALLSNNGNTVSRGYQYNFFTTETTANSGDYLKIAIVPESYNITIAGTGEGIMNAYIADIHLGSIESIYVYENIPVHEGSAGRFENTSQTTDVLELHMDGVRYQNQADSEINSENSDESNDSILWIPGIAGCVVFLVITLMFVIRKRNKK